MHVIEELTEALIEAWYSNSDERKEFIESDPLIVKARAALSSPRRVREEAIEEAAQKIEQSRVLCSHKSFYAELVRLLKSSPEEASKPHEICAWMADDGRVIPAKTMEAAKRDGGAMLSSVRPYTVPLTRGQSASQPSAASGRELPPLPQPVRRVVCVVKDFFLSRKQATPARDYYTADQMRERDAMWMERIAALTGAAPADANVGGHSTLDTGYFGKKLNIIVRDLSHYTPQEMARELVRLAKVADEGVAVKETTTLTAPEVSAPADKVDAHRHRIARSLAFRQISSDGAWVVIRLPQDDSWDADQDAAADFDAAIDRMRSESGKGGKP